MVGDLSLVLRKVLDPIFHDSEFRRTRFPGRTKGGRVEGDYDNEWSVSPLSSICRETPIYDNTRNKTFFFLFFLFRYFRDFLLH